jgi:membrane protease YdiL (CAAX protease family)
MRRQPVRVTEASTAFRLWTLALAVVLWLVCFAVLLRFGTWAPFVVCGTALAGLTLWCDAAARALLRQTHWQALAVGLASGLLMVGLTHVGFALLTRLSPALHAEVVRMFALLRVADFPKAMSAGLIAVIASCEEVIFRGALLGPPARRGTPWSRALDRAAYARIVALAVAYAAAMGTSGSPLLVAWALVCGLLWGALRLVTHALIAPIAAHVVWDLGVLIVWPLVPGAG